MSEIDYWKEWASLFRGYLTLTTAGAFTVFSLNINGNLEIKLTILLLGIILVCWFIFYKGYLKTLNGLRKSE